MKRFISLWIIVCFLATLVGLPQRSFAQEPLNLPVPGTMVNLSSSYVPVLVKGLKVHPENPLLFDFILDTGKSQLATNSQAFKTESEKLIKYFLAALTVPEKDLWVNLSPYEKDRIVPEELGKTELGRDMLAQDYILKQLTASLIYPEKQLGKEFWNKVYAKAQQLYGTTEIPVNTFNKVWIVADKAKVLERNNAAYVVGSHLKVMLEEDYMAMAKYAQNKNDNTIGSQVVREIILPELEREINQGQNFAPLRQMFYSMILATWYKLALKDALLNQVYSNKSKTGGVLNDDPAVKQKIYEQYLKAYKKGVFNYIKEDLDAVNKQPTPRKYFSGGIAKNFAMTIQRSSTLAQGENSAMAAEGDMAMAEVKVIKDAAMLDAEMIQRHKVIHNELNEKVANATRYLINMSKLFIGENDRFDGMLHIFKRGITEVNAYIDMLGYPELNKDRKNAYEIVLRSLNGIEAGFELWFPTNAAGDFDEAKLLSESQRRLNALKVKYGTMANIPKGSVGGAINDSWNGLEAIVSNKGYPTAVLEQFKGFRKVFGEQKAIITKKLQELAREEGIEIIDAAMVQGENVPDAAMLGLTWILLRYSGEDLKKKLDEYLAEQSPANLKKLTTHKKAIVRERVGLILNKQGGSKALMDEVGKSLQPGEVALIDGGKVTIHKADEKTLSDERALVEINEALDHNKLTTDFLASFKAVGKHMSQFGIGFAPMNIDLMRISNMMEPNIKVMHAGTREMVKSSEFHGYDEIADTVYRIGWFGLDKQRHGFWLVFPKEDYAMAPGDTAMAEVKIANKDASMIDEGKVSEYIQSVFEGKSGVNMRVERKEEGVEVWIYLEDRSKAGEKFDKFRKVIPYLEPVTLEVFGSYAHVQISINNDRELKLLLTDPAMAEGKGSEDAAMLDMVKQGLKTRLGAYLYSIRIPGVGADDLEPSFMISSHGKNGSIHEYGVRIVPVMGNKNIVNYIARHEQELRNKFPNQVISNFQFKDNWEINFDISDKETESSEQADGTVNQAMASGNPTMSSPFPIGQQLTVEEIQQLGSEQFAVPIASFSIPWKKSPEMPIGIKMKAYQHGYTFSIKDDHGTDFDHPYEFYLGVDLKRARLIITQFKIQFLVSKGMNRYAGDLTIADTEKVFKGAVKQFYADLKQVINTLGLPEQLPPNEELDAAMATRRLTNTEKSERAKARRDVEFEVLQRAKKSITVRELWERLKLQYGYKSVEIGTVWDDVNNDPTRLRVHDKLKIDEVDEAYRKSVRVRRDKEFEILERQEEPIKVSQLWEYLKSAGYPDVKEGAVWNDVRDDERFNEHPKLNIKGRAKGGIDLNAKNIGLDVTTDGKGIEMNFDPSLLDEFRKGDFSGVVPVILKITPIQSALPILGLADPQPVQQVAKL